MRLERALTVVRDAGCIGVGLWGITYQQVTGRVSWELLACFLALLGAPGVWHLWSIKPGGSGTGGTPGSSSPAQPPPSPTPSPSSPVIPGGDGP